MAGISGVSGPNVATFDKTTQAQNTIDYAHHEIHAGSFFTFYDTQSINSAGTYTYLLTTANTTKWPHLTFNATGSAITEVEVFEGCARAGSTAATVYNANRNSSTTNGMTVHRGTAAGANGTRIFHMKSGSSQGGSRAPMTAERNDELILKQNSKYLIRFTSGTDSNLINLQLGFYEHTNRA